MRSVDFLEQATGIELPAIIELKTNSVHSKHRLISKGAIEAVNELKNRIDSLLVYIDDLCETNPLDIYKNSSFLARRSGKSLTTVFNCFHKHSTGKVLVQKVLSHHHRYNGKSLIVKVFYYCRFVLLIFMMWPYLQITCSMGASPSFTVGINHLPAVHKPCLPTISGMRRNPGCSDTNRIILCK